MLTKTIPSYLYTEYNDDDDVQGFIAAYNSLTQAYVDWYNGLNLPIYTQDPVSGPLLDWVGEGLYGLARPVLPSNIMLQTGPFNTWRLNTLAFNAITSTIPVGTIYVTTDDIYRRILTWLFFKGDGKVFNIRWLKRRIMWFLYGTNGINFNVDQTYIVSVTFTGAQINIDVSAAPTFIATVFKEAITAGVLEIPFQYTLSITI